MTTSITREGLAALASSHGAAATSQLHQEAFVLEVLGHKEGGYFVEVGAASGVALSNTYLLEKFFGWTGILVEPARVWHVGLRRDRAAQLSTNAAWRESGVVLPFMETADACLSSLSCRASGDGFAETRLAPTTTTYDVVTISLQDLLTRYKAPHFIDYLSLDTEGSEGDVLETFDFGKHLFRVVTCEHNHNKERQEKVFQILSQNRYHRVCENLSDFEDWFLHESVR